MTAYFDDLARQVRELDASLRDDEAFVREVTALENSVIHVVTLATGDREFPEELRERIQGIIALWKLDWEDLKLKAKAREWLLNVRESRLFNELHRVFHDVARQKIKTRFGYLSDDPSGIVQRRDAYDQDPS
jgi:hypothetical protein